MFQLSLQVNKTVQKNIRKHFDLKIKYLSFVNNVDFFELITKVKIWSPFLEVLIYIFEQFFIKTTTFTAANKQSN